MPAMVTAVPPLVVPELGVIEVTVGAGFGGGGPLKVKPLFKVPALGVGVGHHNAGGAGRVRRSGR